MFRVSRNHLLMRRPRPLAGAATRWPREIAAATLPAVTCHSVHESRIPRSRSLGSPTTTAATNVDGGLDGAHTHLFSRFSTTLWTVISSNSTKSPIPTSSWLAILFFFLCPPSFRWFFTRSLARSLRSTRVRRTSTNTKKPHNQLSRAADSRVLTVDASERARARLPPAANFAISKARESTERRERGHLQPPALLAPLATRRTLSKDTSARGNVQ